MPARLKPTAPIAADAILVGDPGRALMLAQELLQQPKMSNHARGLWGYTGTTPAGHALTIQATGMGGPSASIVLADLAELGVRRAVRIGTCTSIGELELGELLLVREAHPDVLPDAELTAALLEGLPDAHPGTALSLDTLYRPERGLPPVPADGVDMQTATLLGRGAELEMAIAAVLVVAEKTGAGPTSGEELEIAAKRAGRAAAGILST